jgi:hypothetical protein
MSREIPRGGRMGIPKCGGMHGVQSEQYCYDCQQLYNEEERNKQLKRYADLLEEQLDLEFRGYRRSRKQAPPLEVPTTPQPQQERRGL